MHPCATYVAVTLALAGLTAAEAEAKPRSKRQASLVTETCLPESIKRELAHIRRVYGPIKVVSTRAPRARKSYHPLCRAVDFHPPKGRYAAVLARLRATWRGGLGTYSGRMAHIHIDDGPRFRWHTRVASHFERVPADRPPSGTADGSPIGPAAATSMVASYYWRPQATASGETFAPDGLTAAHRTMPMGTLLSVRHGHKAVTVRVNDRGPYIKGRDIDLSRGAARALGMARKGVARVVVSHPVPRPRPAWDDRGITVGSPWDHRGDNVSQDAAIDRAWDRIAAAYRTTESRPGPAPPEVTARPEPIDGAARANIFRAFEQDLIRPADRCFEYDSLDPRVKRIVSNAARHFGRVAVMTSCYRSYAHNRAVYAKLKRLPTRSFHTKRKAIDFAINGVSRDNLAAWLRKQPGVGGIGRYGNSSIVHVDTRGWRAEWCWGCGGRTRYAKRRVRMAMR